MESDNLLSTIMIDTIYSIGQCAAACEAWNANSSNTMQCGYGQIELYAQEEEGQEGQNEAYRYTRTIWGEPWAVPPGESDRYEFAITTNATLIAGAVPCSYSSSASPTYITSSSTMTASSTTLSSSTSSTSSAQPSPTCPSGNGQIYTANYGNKYL